MGRSGIPRGLGRIIVGSAIVHVVLVVVIAVSATFSGRAAEKPRNVMVTKLVRLGRPRDKKLLPRLHARTPPHRKPVAVPTKKAKPQPNAPTAKQRLQEMSQVSDALARLKKETTPPAGAKNGVAGGEVSDLAKALMGNKYVTEIYRCLKENFDVEGVAPDRVRGKEATVFVRVQADGTLYAPQLRHPSGMPAVDRAVIAAVRRCGKVSPPPPMIRDRVVAEGIQIQFKP